MTFFPWGGGGVQGVDLVFELRGGGYQWGGFLDPKIDQF